MTASNSVGWRLRVCWSDADQLFSSTEVFTVKAAAVAAAVAAVVVSSASAAAAATEATQEENICY